MSKLILLTSKFKMENAKRLNIKYWDMRIKQYFKVKYLLYLLDEIMPGEAMAFNVMNKSNN